MRLGTYPTPVDRLADALGPGRDLWVKRDDLTSARYGGNKVRKLERVLADLVARGTGRIVTVGAAGSHHALATALYAGDVGVGVDAVLVPQLETPHVVETLRATAHRARIFPASSFSHAGAAVADRVACGAHYIPSGGSTLLGSLAYADAALELLEQVRRGELPEPAVVVVALGSGGTAAGLAAGFRSVGSKVRVLGVVVSEPVFWVTRKARRLALAAAAKLSGGRDPGPPPLDIVISHLGEGYGRPTDVGSRAMAHAASFGLTLDGTYTAKAFAAACELGANVGPVVYWHTLSSAPMAGLLAGTPEVHDLPPETRALLLGE